MVKNKALFDRNELSVIFGEDALIDIPASFAARGVCVDTREIEPGNIFVAIRGERVDAHDLIGRAFEAGATCAVAELDWYDKNKDKIAGRPMIITDRAESALCRLGQFHRRRFEIPVVAVAGSNGKTTTKDMIASVLMEKYKVLKTWGNFNNQYGLPLVLLQLDDKYEIAVIEIGTNQPGEVRLLTDVAAPTHGIITNIGEEHLEFLHDLDGVELEETALFAYLSRKGGQVFLNMYDERLARYLPILEGAMTYGTTGDHILNAAIEMDEDLRPIMKFESGDRKIKARLNTIGYGSALNSIPAAAAGFYFGLYDEEIIAGLERFRQPKLSDYGRMKIEKKNGITIINDTYNSNPPSARLALDTLASMKTGGRKFCALADMRELGEASMRSHLDIINYAIEKADVVYLFGDEMRKVLKETDHEKITFFESKNKMTDRLRDELVGGDVLLAKGSRGMKMEDVVRQITE
jgi:UDP-N-acetylmuramoyl-tripeptide--D-alanyl-D-alanine ligase